jgi:hypothetical protein
MALAILSKMIMRTTVWHGVRGIQWAESSAGNAAHPPLMLLKGKTQSASKAQTILGGKSLIKIKKG